MNIIDKLLVLKTPFMPNDSFLKLESSNQKGIVTVFSIGITLSILLALFFFNYNSRPQHLKFSFQVIPFSLGFIFKIVLIGIISAVISSRVFRCPIRILDNIAIVAVSSLPLIIGLLIQIITSQTNSIFGIIGSIIFGIIASFGLRVFYKQDIRKTVLIIFGSLIFVKFIELTLFGIPMS